MSEHKLKPSHIHLIQQLRPFLNRNAIEEERILEIRTAVLRRLKDQESVPYNKLVKGVVKELGVYRSRVADQIGFLYKQNLVESTFGGLPGKGRVRLTEMGKEEWKDNWETKPGPVLAELIREV